MIFAHIHTETRYCAVSELFFDILYTRWIMRTEILVDLADDNVKVEKWANAIQEECISIEDGDTTIKLLQTMNRVAIDHPTTE